MWVFKWSWSGVVIFFEGYFVGFVGFVVDF